MSARTPLDSIFDGTRLLYTRDPRVSTHVYRAEAYVFRIWKVVRSKRVVC